MTFEMDEASRARIDDLLFAVTQQSKGGVHGLLDSVYGFLQRRTDFYYEAMPGDKMGFPPQVAESMVYQYFRKYQEMHERRFPPKAETKKAWEEFEKQKKAQQEAEKNKPKVQLSEEVKKTKAIKVEDAMNKKEPMVATTQIDSVSKPKAAEPAPKKEQSQTAKDMAKISTYNGASLDKYSWSQNIKEVMLQIPVPEGTGAKQMDIKIQAKRLYVKIKGQDAPIIDGELQEKVKIDDSFWSVEDKKFVNITFEKAYEAIWKGIIVGDAEIDPKTVDNSKKVEEFDLETQGHLQKVLYEQERKRQGLPTTDEEKQQKLMADIMKKQAEAGQNPLAGLPYDPEKYGKNTMGSGSGPAIPFRN